MQKYDYDAQIARLTENPDLIEGEWALGEGLFQFATRDGGYYSECGCLTMIKFEPSTISPVIKGIIDENLKNKILQDDRIPSDVKDITPESLPVFKEYQLLIDKMYEE